MTFTRDNCAQTCADPHNATPWYRAYRDHVKDNFYTADRVEDEKALTQNYVDKGIACYIFKSHEPHTVPLYRLYRGDVADHFYTTDKEERDNAIGSLEYKDEGVTGYIYPDDRCGGVPLYRGYNDEGKDHFYTTDVKESDTAEAQGWVKEGITGYVLPY